MHVDGFRFDLGSILGRNQRGELLENAPVLERIAEDPLLSATKIIAEAWDAGGAYMVGHFPGRWAEWNDRFRDDVRRFWRGDENQTRHLATRISGSSDLYLRDGRKPFHSINFVTSHDGFTLRDLVSHNYKHNEANGEENRDGNDNNYSANNGTEGSTLNRACLNLRLKLMKNFITTMMISQGTPMILGGDEICRTQDGNNNAYCQDNEMSWFDWHNLDTYAGYYRFVKEMIAFRLRHHGFMRPEFYSGRENYNAIPDISWFDETGGKPDWDNLGSCLALRILGSRAETLADRDDNDFFIMFNGGPHPERFMICDPLEGQMWTRAIDTGLPSPEAILRPGSESPLFRPADGTPPNYIVHERSMVVLISKYL
jgi:glycogen operon protein